MFDSPVFYLLLGAGASVYAVISLFKGEMNVGRYGAKNIIHYSNNPGFYLLCVFILFALGIGLLMLGKRRLRQHEE